MKNNWILFAASSFLLIASCKKTSTSIVGNWKKDTITMSVNADGTESGNYALGGVTYSPAGKYTANNGVFKLVALSGPSSCAYGDTGTFNFTVNETTLNLTLVNDPCTGRGNAFSGSWTRQ